MNSRLIVIGGGAAGLFAAGFSANSGEQSVLLERNDKPGMKLGITGKGRCNLTNLCPLHEMIENFPVNGRFLYSALNAFPPEKVISFFEDLGVKTKIERGQRVFPSSDKATDIVKALIKFVKKSGVNIITGKRIKNIKYEDSIFSLTTTHGDVFTAEKVIIATGGLSYPGTGSTGDGYKLAESLGHEIVDPKAALVPLETMETWPSDCAGLALKNIRVRLFEGSNEISEEFGEMLFTHFGVSGPVILSVSGRAVPLLRKGKKISLSIDLKPALSEEVLETRVLRDFEKFSRKQIKNGLDELLPKSLIPVMIKLWGINENKEINKITKPERKILIKLLKDLRLNISAARPVSEAIVTSGGVNIKTINPKTMESKIIPGLYFAGEIIDVDGYTGGFNLQAAFSTGYLAGISAVGRNA